VLVCGVEEDGGWWDLGVGEIVVSLKSGLKALNANAALQSQNALAQHRLHRESPPLTCTPCVPPPHS